MIKCNECSVFVVGTPFYYWIKQAVFPFGSKYKKVFLCDWCASQQIENIPLFQCRFCGGYHDENMFEKKTIMYTYSWTLDRITYIEICPFCYLNSNVQRCNQCCSEYAPCLDTDMGLCPQCEHSRNLTVHSYDYKPEQFLFLSLNGEEKFTGISYYGVELEIDEGNRTSFKHEFQKSEIEHFYLKEDGSLTERGLEIVSQPASLSFHKKEIKWTNVMNIARECDFVSHNSDRCGLHIHINRESFASNTHLLKTCLFVYSNPVFIHSFSRRGWTEYSKRKDIQPREYVLDDDRYAAINSTNTDTVEFRMFRGTLIDSTLFACLEFMESLMFYCHARIPEKLIGKSKNYIRWVRDNQKSYPYLVSYLHERDILDENGQVASRIVHANH